MHGLEIAFPFLDRDLITFMMAIPGEVHAWNGVPKAILRKAMTGVVPGQILDRHEKSDFTHLVNETLEQNYTRLMNCFKPDAQAFQWNYLDGAVLEKSLASLKKGLKSSDCRSAWVLWDLLSLELWLQVFFRGTQGRIEVPVESEKIMRKSEEVKI